MSAHTPACLPTQAGRCGTTSPLRDCRKSKQKQAHFVTATRSLSVNRQTKPSLKYKKDYDNDLLNKSLGVSTEYSNSTLYFHRVGSKYYTLSMTSEHLVDDFPLFQIFIFNIIRYYYIKSMSSYHAFLYAYPVPTLEISFQCYLPCFVSRGGRQWTIFASWNPKARHCRNRSSTKARPLKTPCKPVTPIITA